VLLLLGDAQEEADAAVVDEPLLQPLKEGLPLAERATVSVTLKEGVVDVQAVPVGRELPLVSPLGVDIEDAVAPNELLPLVDAKKEAETKAVDEPQLLPLKEGLPLTELVTEPTALEDKDVDVQTVAVSWELPLGSPLCVEIKDAVALTVLLPLGDAQEVADATAVSELLLLPLNEGLPLAERVTVPMGLRDGDMDEQAVPVSWELPLGSLLGVDIKDADALTVLLPLGDATEEAEATTVVEPLLLPLKEGLPLSERIAETRALTDWDTDVQAVPVK